MNEQLTNADYEQFGRLASIHMPDLVKQIREKYEPFLKDIVHIPEIFKKVTYHFPDLDHHDRNVFLTAVTYSLYCPAALIEIRIANAPAGMRRALADILGYENGTNLNYYMNIARAHVKNARYVKKIELITNQFKN